MGRLEHHLKGKQHSTMAVQDSNRKSIGRDTAAAALPTIIHSSVIVWNWWLENVTRLIKTTTKRGTGGRRRSTGRKCTAKVYLPPIGSTYTYLPIDLLVPNQKSEIVLYGISAVYCRLLPLSVFYINCRLFLQSGNNGPQRGIGTGTGTAGW